MSHFAQIRFYYPDGQYVEAQILFGTPRFFEATKLADVFISGFNAHGDVSAHIMSVYAIPQGSTNIFSGHDTSGLREFLDKYRSPL